MPPRFPRRPTRPAAWRAVTALSLCIPGCWNDDAAGTRPVAGSPAEIGPAATTGEVRRHDFGVVLVGSTLKHTFRVTNDTAAAWALEDVVTSCSCTVPEVTPHRIAPGGHADVRAVWKTGGENHDGEKTVTVTFAPEVPGESAPAVAAGVRAANCRLSSITGRPPA